MQKLLKARVIAETTVNNEPKKSGDIVEVDVNTLRNLAAKGRLVAAESEAPVIENRDVEPENRDPETKVKPRRR